MQRAAERLARRSARCASTCAPATRRRRAPRARRATRRRSWSRRPSRCTCCWARARARRCARSTPSSSTRSTRSRRPSAVRTWRCRSSAWRSSASGDPQRIGLSATARPLEEVASFLGGDRPCRCRRRDGAAEARPRDPRARARHGAPAAAASRGRSAGARSWPSCTRARRARRRASAGCGPRSTPSCWRSIRAHRSTILFVNSRGLCERLAQRLNELAGEELVAAHHGSVSHAKRARDRGRAQAGPPARHRRHELARARHRHGRGRSGAPGRVPGLGRARPAARRAAPGTVSARPASGASSRSSAATCSRRGASRSRCARGAIESMRVPENPLDVLAQQIVAMVCDEPRTVERARAPIRPRAPRYPRPAARRRSPPCSTCSPAAIRATTSPTCARGSPGTARRDVLSRAPRRRAGRAPERGHHPRPRRVRRARSATDGPRVGELDEEMVYEIARGRHVHARRDAPGASRSITRDRVIVSPAPGEPGRLPFWKGDGPGRPIELGRALGALRARARIAPARRGRWRALARARRRSTRSPPRTSSPTCRAARAHRRAADRPRDHGRALPRRARRLARLHPHARSARACTRRGRWRSQRSLSRARGLRGAARCTPTTASCCASPTARSCPTLELLLPDPDEVEDLVTRQLGARARCSPSLFRENAARALLLPRRRPEQRTPLWAQRLKAKSAARCRRARIPTSRSCSRPTARRWRDVFDLPRAAATILRARARPRDRGARRSRRRAPSPFARSLVFAYVAAVPLRRRRAGRRAQAPGADARPQAAARAARRRRSCASCSTATRSTRSRPSCRRSRRERRARDADELHDLLRRLGDLRPDEVRGALRRGAPRRLARGACAASGARPSVAAGAASARWIAAEDAGLYRDALGALPPSGLPSAFLEPVPSARCERSSRRYARAHGPFRRRELGARASACAPRRSSPLLARSLREGRLVRGELRPGGTRARVVRRRGAAPHQARARSRELRGEIAPSTPRRSRASCRRGTASARASRAPPTPSARARRSAQLEGLALPWSALGGRDPARARRRASARTLLDCCARRGRAGLGRPRRARARATGACASTGASGTLPALLEPRGALPEPRPAAGGRCSRTSRRARRVVPHASSSARCVRRIPARRGRDFEAALWDLVWAGLVTNDTFQPLRALRRGPRARARRARRAPIARRAAAGRCVGELARSPPRATPSARSPARARCSSATASSAARRAAPRSCPAASRRVYRVLRGDGGGGPRAPRPLRRGPRRARSSR